MWRWRGGVRQDRAIYVIRSKVEFVLDVNLFSLQLRTASVLICLYSIPRGVFLKILWLGGLSGLDLRQYQVFEVDAIALCLPLTLFEVSYCIQR